MQVTVEPEGARSSGAQRRVDSGYTATLLPISQHTVSFKEAAGWNKPADVNVTVYSNETTPFMGTYMRVVLTGSFRIAIEPQAARDAGAQWRVDDGSWRNSETYLNRPR